MLQALFRTLSRIGTLLRSVQAKIVMTFGRATVYSVAVAGYYRTPTSAARNVGNKIPLDQPAAGEPK